MNPIRLSILTYSCNTMKIPTDSNFNINRIGCCIYILRYSKPVVLSCNYFVFYRLFHVFHICSICVIEIPYDIYFKGEKIFHCHHFASYLASTKVRGIFMKIPMDSHKRNIKITTYTTEELWFQCT